MKKPNFVQVKMMQAVEAKKIKKTKQIFSVNPSVTPHAANDAEIIQIPHTDIERAFPVLGTKISAEFTQLLFASLDALVLTLASYLVLPEFGHYEIGAVTIGVLTFILFKACLGGYSKKTLG